MPTLRQRLGSFPSESRTEILLWCRRDYSRPPPINRGGSHGLREEKIGSKVSQKTSLPPSPRCRFSSSASSSFFLRHRKPTLSPFLPPALPWATTTTISGMETSISTISRRPNTFFQLQQLRLSPSSPLCRFPFLPLPVAAAPANSPVVSTAGFRSSSPSQPSPPRLVVRYPSPGSSSSPWKFHCS